MSAAEKNVKVTVRFEMSELDQNDGLRIKARQNVYSYVAKLQEGTYSTWSIEDITGLNGWGTVSGIIDYSKGKVIDSAADVTNVSFTVVNTKNESILATVDDNESQGLFTDRILEDGSDVTVIVNLTRDVRSADETLDQAAPADNVDDRLQKTYGVYLEKSPETGLYYLAANYTVNAKDDVAKLVNNGDYINLPDFDVPAASDNDYVYEYYFKDGAIYGTYVKAEYSKFVGEATQPENTLDKDGDGIVTCDEYYGVTGLKWGCYWSKMGR